MNKEEFTIKLAEVLERCSRVLAVLPEDIDIAHMDYIDGDIFLEEMDTFEEYLTESRKFGVSENMWYYLSDRTKLAVHDDYTIEGVSFSVTSFIKESRRALQKLSEGTCVISAKTVPSSKAEVITCATEEKR